MLTKCKSSSILFVIAALAASCCAALAQAMDPPEYRMSQVYSFSSHFANPAATTTMINTLADSNFNVVVPEIRKRGDAYYNSAYEPWATDVEEGYDPLADILEKAHARNMQVFGWIVTYRIWPRSSTYVAPSTHIWSKHPEWAMIDASGRNYEGSYYNLDPGVPGVQQYICDLVKDIVTKYPTLDGITFDCLRYPGYGWGYNSIAKARFKAESGFDPPTTGYSTTDPQWIAWQNWKRRQVTDLMKRCYLESVYVNPRIKVTASTEAWMGGDPVTDFAGTRPYTEVCQDHQGWMNQHFLDVNILLNYKRDWTGLLADTNYRYNGYTFGNQQADHRLWSDYLEQTQESSDRHCVDEVAGYLNIMQGILDQWGYSRAQGVGLGIFRYGATVGAEDPANPGLPKMSGSNVIYSSTTGYEWLEPYFYQNIKPTMFQNPASVPAMPWKDAPTKGYLFGQITNAHRQDDPIYGGWMYNIPVTATDSDGNVFTSTTDATGTYGFIDLEPGDYRVSININGYVPIQDLPITVTAGRAAKLDLQLMPILPLELHITWPTTNSTYVTQGSAITLGGTVVGNGTGKRVACANSRGGSVDCMVSGVNWISKPIALQKGENIVTVNANDATGNTDRQTLTVIYEPPVYVSPAGNDGNDGSSWASAKKTVQAGLDAALAGQHVWVAAGAYNERITLKQNVHLFGGFAGAETDLSQRDFAANATTMAANSAGPVVSCVNVPTDQPTLDGFTITNGLALEGGGVYCVSSSPTIRNNIITGNSALDYGGAIYCHNGSPVIANNTITGNASDWLGGGIFCSASYTQSAPVISNNVIAGNSANRYGGGIYCAFSSPVVTGNTITSNTASSQGGGIYCWDDSSPTVSNNIVAFNSSGIYRSGGSPVVRNNCVHGNTGYDYSGLITGTDDISADPLFANRTGGDYHIAPASPCINAGWSSAPGMASADMDGDARIAGSSVDMGADESVPSPMSVSEAKKKAPLTPVHLRGLVVTATFPDYFYAESADRSSGIRVDRSGHGLIPGMRASVFGAVNTDAAVEVHIDADAVLNTGYGHVDSLACTNKSLGGGDWSYNATTGAGQRGVDTYGWVKSGDTWSRQWLAGTGLNNIGLLIQTFGRVTQATGGCFYIDDGSHLEDGSGNIGVKVLGSVPDVSPVGKYVEVTGISSCFQAEPPSMGMHRQVLATDVVIR